MPNAEINPYINRVSQCEDAASLAICLKSERARLLACITAGADDMRPDCKGAVGGLALARSFSDLMDAVLTHMFTLACGRIAVDPTQFPVSIVATGGYGRRELCPFSDIDITFIPQRDGDATTDIVIRDMFRQVMDICIAQCGLEVGYAYRLFEDCTTLDHQTSCGLLDARLITGNSRLFIQFEDAFWLGFNSTEFIFTKIEERERSLKKWGKLPRVVEPQLKEGPGGLRDLQTAVWLYQAKWQLNAARVRGPRAIDMLIREAEITKAEGDSLNAAKELLIQARNSLHAVTGAERDVLVITRQEEIARLLGYVDPVDNKYSACSHSPPPAVERFMADLYPAMAAVRQTADQIMRKIGGSRLILGIGLDCRHKQIVPANSSLETDNPDWLLWTCELAQRYELELSTKIEQSASVLLKLNPILTDPERTSQVFTRILSNRGKVYPILQKMADLGILGWYLPEFGNLMDLIPYDPSHDFTVGQHTLNIIKQLENLQTSPEGEEQTEMRGILENLLNPEQLMLAVLLHDSGKAIPGRPHSETGEEIAQAVCSRLGWNVKAAENVCFLIRHHLLMSETSRLRDLNLDVTIANFTKVVDDLDRLNMLYLLTYADTRSVGEGVWTQVIARFLRELWRRSAAVLCEEEPIGYDDASLARARRRLLKELSPENIPENEVTEHVEAMPPNYLLNQSLRQIALHIGFIRRLREEGPIIEFYDERDATYTELTVCAYDDPQPGLLAKIAGVLYVAELNVHSAQVVTRETDSERIALDTLWVDYHGRQLSPGKRREISLNLKAVLAANMSVDDLLHQRETSLLKKSKSSSDENEVSIRSISIQNDLSETLTFVELTVKDIPGVFYHLCDAFARLEWGIQSSRVSTWGAEARLSFYLTGLGRVEPDEVKMALINALGTRT